MSPSAVSCPLHSDVLVTARLSELTHPLPPFQSPPVPTPLLIFQLLDKNTAPTKAPSELGMLQPQPDGFLQEEHKKSVTYRVILSPGLWFVLLELLNHPCWTCLQRRCLIPPGNLQIPLVTSLLCDHELWWSRPVLPQHQLSWLFAIPSGFRGEFRLQTDPQSQSCLCIPCSSPQPLEWCSVPVALGNQRQDLGPMQQRRALCVVSSTRTICNSAFIVLVHEGNITLPGSRATMIHKDQLGLLKEKKKEVNHRIPERFGLDRILKLISQVYVITIPSTTATAPSSAPRAPPEGHQLLWSPSHGDSSAQLRPEPPQKAGKNQHKFHKNPLTAGILPFSIPFLGHIQTP